MSDPEAARSILELARWAPSGDNTQPWRFEIVSDEHVVVHGFDTRRDCVYDLDGHASQVSLGALLETIAISATRFRLSTAVQRREGQPEERPVFDVRFRHQPQLAEDELAAYITQRCVQRRALSVRPLTDGERALLERAVGPDFQFSWFEGWSGRARIAWLNFVNAWIRLTAPEAYEVHRNVIDWAVQESEDRIPAAALGASPLTLVLMRWAMTSWKRIDFLNRYLAGTLAARIELDLVPGLACAAHCVLLARRPPASMDDYIAAGRALQRFWLTATRLGLQFQPEYTPLVFARYAREARRFTSNGRALRKAQRIRDSLDGLLGGEAAARAVFMGRIGAGKAARARSVRLPLSRLLQKKSPL